MKKKEFLEMCELMSNDSGLLSFDILSDNGQSLNIIGSYLKCTDTSVIIKDVLSNKNRGFSLSTIVSINEYIKSVIATAPDSNLSTIDREEDIKKFLKSNNLIAKDANQIENIYKSAIKNNALHEKKGRIISELNDFYNQFGKEKIARIFVAKWFEKIEEYQEAIAIYKCCDYADSAILCSKKCGDDNLYLNVPARAIPFDKDDNSLTNIEEQYYQGYIMNWNQEKICGFIKLNKIFCGKTSVFFHLSSVYDYELRNYLYNSKSLPQKKIEVSFLFGDNGKADPVATKINPIVSISEIATSDGQGDVKQGFIDYYNSYDDYGKIISSNKSFGFKSKAIIDPYLKYYFENNFNIDNIDILFTVESLNGKQIVSKMISTHSERDIIISKFGNIPNTQKFDADLNNKTPKEILLSPIHSKLFVPLPQYREIPIWIERTHIMHSSGLLAQHQGIEPISYVKMENNPLKDRDLFSPKEKDPCQKGQECLRFNPQRAKELFLDALQQNIKIDTALPRLVDALNMLEGDQCNFAMPIIDYYGRSLPQEKVINLRISLLQKAKRYGQLVSAIDSILPITYNNSKRMHLTHMKAQALSRIDKYDEAIAAFEAYKKTAITTKKQSDVTNADKGIAYCYYLSGNIPQAKEIARVVLKYNANDSVALAIINDRLEASTLETEEMITPSISVDREIKGYLRDKIDSLSLEASAASTNIKKYIKDGKIVGTVSDVSREFGYYITTKLKGMSAEAKGNGWLFLAKIVEAILNNSEEKIEILGKNKITNQTLNLYAGRSMLAYGDYLALSQSNKLDTLRFYYSQTLNLITEDQDDAINAFNRMISSFYIARDELVNIVQHPKQTENKYLQLTESRANDSLKSLFIQSFSLDNRCNARMKKVLYNLFDNISESKGKVISFDGLRCDAGTISNKENYYETWLSLRKEYNSWLEKLTGELSGIIILLQSSTAINEHLTKINNVLEEDKLLELDTQYLNEYRDILSKLNSVHLLNDFDRREDIFNSIIASSQSLMRDIKESPTVLSYDFIKNAIEAIENYCAELLNNLYSEHLPQIVIEKTRNSYLLDGCTEFWFSISNGYNLQPADIWAIDFPKEIKGIIFESDKTLEKIQRVKSGETVEGMRKIIISSDYPLSYVEFEVTISYSYHQSLEKQSTKEIKQQFHIDLQGENEFVEIPNKYRSIAEGTAVTGEMFIGRDSEISDVVDMLKNGQEMLSNSGIVLYGQKRAGKSSILANLQKAIEEKYGKYTYLFFDMGSMGEIIPHSISNILSRIILVIGMELRKNYPVIYKILLEKNIEFKPQAQLIQDNPANASNYFKECFSEIMNCLETIGGKNKYIPMFLVDEFTYVYEWIEEGSETTIKDFPHFWKAFIANNRVCSIVIGQDNMPVFTHMPAYANDFACMKMWPVSFLNDSGAKELIYKPLCDEHAEPHIDELAIEKIIKLTAGSAYLIVFLCNKMVDYMNKKRIDKMTNLTLKQFLYELLNAYEDWENLFESQFVDPSKVVDSTIVANDNWAILSYIANHHDEMYYTKRENIPNKILYDCSESYRNKLLSELERRDVLIYNKQKDSYKIKIDLMRLVLQYKYEGKFELYD